MTTQSHLKHMLPMVALLIAPMATVAAQAEDRDEFKVAKPQEMIVDRSMSPTKLAELLKPVNAFYSFWNGGSKTLLQQAVSADFVDHQLPRGRPQGPKGPLVGLKSFLAVVPDLRIEILQQMVVGDRVTSLLHCTGHFTGFYRGTKGAGQEIDFISVDILRVRDGHITDNWHLEDNLTFMKQIGAIK